MPTPHTKNLPRDPGRATGIPSYGRAFRRAFPWVDAALCARAPYDGHKWIVEPSNGWENPNTVLELFEVCHACPVRRQCLESALTEAGFRVMGVWGATTITERRAVWRSNELFSREDLAAAVELFEETYEQRFEQWRQRAFVAAERLERQAAAREPTGPLTE